jgi:hypothetical protein
LATASPPLGHCRGFRWINKSLVDLICRRSTIASQDTHGEIGPRRSAVGEWYPRLGA